MGDERTTPRTGRAPSTTLRVLVALGLLLALVGGAGVTAAEDGPDYDPCNNPNVGLVNADETGAAHSADAIEHAAERIGCELPG